MTSRAERARFIRDQLPSAESRGYDCGYDCGQPRTLGIRLATMNLRLCAGSPC